MNYSNLVNLRPPFADPALVIDVAKRVDVMSSTMTKLVSSFLVRDRRSDAGHAAESGCSCRGLCSPGESNQYLAHLRYESSRGRGAVGEWQSPVRPGS